MAEQLRHSTAGKRKIGGPAGLVAAVLFAGVIGYGLLFALPRLIGW